MGAVLEPLPADPAVATGQAAGGEVEQQAAEQALVAVAQAVAQIGSQRLAVAEWMVALDPLVEFLDALRLADEFQPQGRQVGQRGADGRPGGGARPVPDRFLQAASGTALGGQGEDAELLELGEQALGGGQALAALGCPPAQMLSDSAPELGATQHGAEADGFLNVRDLLAGQAVAEEGGGLEVPDQRVQGGRPSTAYLARAKILLSSPRFPKNSKNL